MFFARCLKIAEKVSFHIIGQKLVENTKKEKKIIETFLVIFK